MPRTRGHAPQRLEQDWVCKDCTDNKGGKYKNYAWRKECNQCHVVKGKVFHSHVQPLVPSQRSTAVRQVQMAAQQSKLEAMRKDKDKLIHELQRKLKAKESDKGKPEDEDKDADEEDEEQTKGYTLVEAKATLKHLKETLGKRDSHPDVVRLRANITQKEQAKLEDQPGHFRISKAEGRIRAAQKHQEVLNSKSEKLNLEWDKLVQRKAELKANLDAAKLEEVEAQTAHDALLQELQTKSRLQAAPPQPLADDGLGALAALAQTLPKEVLGELSITADDLQKLLGQLGAYQKQQRADSLAAAQAAEAAERAAAAAAASAAPKPPDPRPATDANGDANMGTLTDDDGDLEAIIKHLSDTAADEDPKAKFVAAKSLLLQRKEKRNLQKNKFSKPGA